MIRSTMATIRTTANNQCRRSPNETRWAMLAPVVVIFEVEAWRGELIATVTFGRAGFGLHRASAPGPRKLPCDPGAQLAIVGSSPRSAPLTGPDRQHHRPEGGCRCFTAGCHARPAL